jgi:hypothetical protein
MDTKIILSVTWIVVMMIYFLGDILRIISGDVVRGMAGRNLTQWVYLAMAVLMLIPILMVFLTLVLPQPASRWTNIIAAGFFYPVQSARSAHLPLALRQISAGCQYGVQRGDDLVRLELGVIRTLNLCLTSLPCAAVFFLRFTFGAHSLHKYTQRVG